MCDKTVKDNPFFWHYVPDRFVMQQQLKIWHDDDEYHELIEGMKAI